MSAEGRTGGQLIVDALELAGVTHCFGVPGESFLGILDALHDSSITVVSTRHEGAGSFMASGFGKLSGQIAVCFGTRAVGTANMAIGIHNAQQDSAPMIAIAGQVNRSFTGREAFQEADLVAAMRPLAKWATQIPSADMAPEIMARAVSRARSGRPGPVFLAVPQDVCDEVSTEKPWPLAPVIAPQPQLAAVDRALQALQSAERPLVFAGGGLYHAPNGLELLTRFAELAEVPVISSWRHHDEFPNDHRLYLGSTGLGSSPEVWQRLGEADVVLVIGNRMQENATDGYTYPLPGARLLHVDIDPTALVSHRTPEIAIVADAAATIEAMIGRLPELPIDRDALQARRARNAADRDRFVASTVIPAAHGDVAGVAYPEVLRGLAEVLTPETIVASDAGNFYAWLARYHRFRNTRTYVGPASGAMGYGLPAAIGAKIARPDRPVVSVSGDGGFLMTVSELETAVRYGAAVVAIVMDNARHGTIRMHQESHYPGRVIGTELGVTDLSMVARGLGVQGHLVETNSDFEPALRAAIDSRAPSLIHVRMDRDQLSVRGRLRSESTPSAASADGVSTGIARAVDEATQGVIA